MPIQVVCPAIVGYPCPDRASKETRALSASVLGLLALPLLDVYGRVGLARWESEREIRFTSMQTQEGTDPTFGVGVPGRRLPTIRLRVLCRSHTLGRPGPRV